jgi:hypothetical protein
MSVESDRAKIKRFHARHPDYRKQVNRRKKLRSQLLPHVVGVYQTFELADPRDETNRPRIISYGHISWQPIWKQFLLVSGVCNAPWASWLRGLLEAGVEPIERVESAVGHYFPVSQTFAMACVQMRFHQLNREHTGNIKVTPVWLLNRPKGRYRYITKAGEKRQRGFIPRPVGCFHNGIVTRYRTAQIPPLASPNDVLPTYCGIDKEGRTWFYDD